MSDPLIYRQGATEPPAAVAVANDTGAPADLSAHALTVKVGNSRQVIFVKTAGVTFSGGVVTVDWDPVGEIGDLPVGQYLFDIVATTAGESRKFSGSLQIAKTVGPTPAIIPATWTAPTVVGSRTDGTALASLLDGLESLGLIVDTSTA